jgi:hypothetical protein
MIRETVAAKLRQGEAYLDLVNRGFKSGSLVKCPCAGCEVCYRLFYRSAEEEEMPIAERTLDAAQFQSVIEGSHPQHKLDRIRQVRSLH